MAKRSQRRGLNCGPWLALLLGLVFSGVLAEGIAATYIRLSGITVPIADDYDFAGQFQDHNASYHLVYRLEGANERFVCGNQLQENPYRFAVLGDSFAFGAGVPDCQDFSSIVNLSLPGVEIQNVSQVGAGFDQYLEILEERVCDQGFDGLFLLLFGDDFLDSPESLLSSMARHSNVAGLALNVLGRPSPNHWAVRYLADLGLVDPPPPGTPLNLTWRQTTVQPYRGRGRRLRVTLLADLSESRECGLHLSTPPQERLDRNTVLLHELLHRASSCSQEVWVAVVPNGAAYSHKMREFILSFGGMLPPEGLPGVVEKIVREATAEHGARFVETTRAFAPEADDAYYVKDVHWTPRGHQIMAGLLMRALEERGSLRNVGGL